ncbi:SART-1 protein [Schizophyllum commune]
MSMEESISLEETNKIRISLGLKPLTDDKAPADSQEETAAENYKKQREREAKERETKKIQERIAKHRNKRELNASLKGATLGDAEGDDDTLKWIKRSKKKQKELAEKRLREQEEQEKQVLEEYGERDLAGLKVNHDFEELDEGEDRILTLKDSRILDNEEDELQNVEMAEHERTKKNNEMKIKKADYTGYDDEEFKEGHVGMKRAVLAKYDEDMDGETGFRLGSSIKTSKAARAEQEQAAASVNKTLLSIDYEKVLSTDDYLKEGDVGFKKPKKKKKHQARKVTVDDIDIKPDEAMDVDIKPVARERNLDANFVDDDELQAALARSRRAKLNKTKKLKPEDLAKKIAEERAREEAEAEQAIKVEEIEAVTGEDGGLTFDDTTEFVRAVGLNPVPERKPKVEPREASLKPSREVSMAPPASEGGDVPMDEIETNNAVKEEPEENEMAMLDQIEAAWKAEASTSEAAVAAADEVGTQSEQTFKSMASTLGILRQTGLLATPNADQIDREKTQLQQNLWLAEQRRRVAQREMERLASRGQPKDQAQREYENRMREQQEAREQLETFKHYKPDINIVYYDEFGRSLTPKEAWKALSHRFHGKGSGKAKTEKRLRKIAEERKQQAMSSGDTPTSMASAFQARQEKTGQAHFVLSVGNRGAVPQADGPFVDAQPLGKKQGQEKDGKGKKKGKGKAEQQQAATNTGFMTLPAPQASPGPRAGFSRIGTVAEADRSGTGTPVGERSKVQFGLKRKAEGEHESTPPPAKRQ